MAANALMANRMAGSPSLAVASSAPSPSVSLPSSKIILESPILECEITSHE